MQNELTGPKLSFTRSRRHDEPGEPIESTHTLEIVLKTALEVEKSDTDQLKNPPSPPSATKHTTSMIDNWKLNLPGHSIVLHSFVS